MTCMVNEVYATLTDVLKKKSKDMNGYVYIPDFVHDEHFTLTASLFMKFVNL